jgi:hypothetical protein
MGGVCSTDGEMINLRKILVGKPEGKRPLGRSRRTCENHVKEDLKGKGVRMWTGFI